MSEQIIETDWELEANFLKNNSFGTNSRIGLKLKNVKGLGVFYQELDNETSLGAFLENRPELNDTLDLAKSRAYIKEHESDFVGYNLKHPWWLLEKPKVYNFKNDTNYLIITSTNLEKAVEEAASNLLRLANNTKKHIIHINKHFTKKI